MSETDLQLGGGYIYQWECAVLLALNYFFEPRRYNPTLFDLVEGFLGQVAKIHLEGEDREKGVDLEDIALVNDDRRNLVKIKAKQAEGKAGRGATLCSSRRSTGFTTTASLPGSWRKPGLCSSPAARSTPTWRG